MAKAKDFATTLAFDQDAVREGFATWARYNERFLGIALDVAESSSGLAARTTEAAISNLRGVTVVRDEPTDYGKAISDFVQKQADLGMKTTEAYGTLAQKAQTEMAELATEAGENFGEKAAANVNGATKKATAAAKKAA